MGVYWLLILVYIYKIFKSTCSFSFPGCGGTFTNLTGVITSPKYPSNYPNRADCVYLIQQPEGLRITLTFQDFQLQEGSNCVFDYLEVTWRSLSTNLCSNIMKYSGLQVTWCVPIIVCSLMQQCRDMQSYWFVNVVVCDY